MAETVVKVGEGGKRHRWPLWKSAFVFLAVIILAGGAGVGLRWLREYRADKKAAEPAAIAKKLNNAQDLAIGGDYEKAHKTITGALDNPRLSSEERYDLIFQQGVVYENQQKYDDAIKSYQQAEGIQKTQAVAEAIARSAEAKGDKDLAISYYKKAITLIDPNHPTAQDTTKAYEYAITNLGGKP